MRALAEAEGVSAALLDSWARLSPDLTQKSEQAAQSAAPKAWRWVGEMQQIANSFEAVGLPREFHDAAAAVYARLAAPAKNHASADEQQPTALHDRLKRLLEQRP